MKKVLFAFALMIGFSIAAQAQTKTEKTEKSDNKTVQTTQDIVTKDYKVMDDNSLPVAVLEKVGTKYGGYAIKEIYRADDGDYKLTLLKDGERTIAYFNKKGEEITHKKK